MCVYDHHESQLSVAHFFCTRVISIQLPVNAFAPLYTEYSSTAKKSPKKCLNRLPRNIGPAQSSHDGTQHVCCWHAPPCGQFIHLIRAGSKLILQEESFSLPTAPTGTCIAAVGWAIYLLLLVVCALWGDHYLERLRWCLSRAHLHRALVCWTPTTSINNLMIIVANCFTTCCTRTICTYIKMDTEYVVTNNNKCQVLVAIIVTGYARTWYLLLLL